MPKFDVAILGTSLAGLLAAVQLGNAGKKVIIYDTAAHPGGRAVNVNVSGRRYDAIPHPVSGFEREGLLWNICADAGIPEIPLKPAEGYQVILPCKRITVHPSVDETLDELQREFPAEANKVRKIYAAVCAQAVKASKSAFSSYLLQRRSAHDFLKTTGISSELYDFFDVQSRIFEGFPLSAIRLNSLVLLLTKPPRVPRSGYSWLAARLCERIRQQGGELHFDVCWPQIMQRSRKAAGLQTETGMLEADNVILNAIETGRDKRLLLRIRRGVIPEEMKGAVCCLSDNTDKRDLFTLTLGACESGEPTSDIVTASAVFFSPRMETVTRRNLLDRISAIMPFLDEFVVEEGEDDPAVRSYPLDSGISLMKAGRNGFFRTTLKNFYVLPDSGSVSPDTIQASRQLVRRLS